MGSKDQTRDSKIRGLPIDMIHDTHNEDCWCCPIVEWVDDTKIIIHNSKAEAN